MKLTRLRRPKKARIEIIPMIDTIFFLLVFYILTSLAMTRQRGIEVQLPHAATGQKMQLPPLTLTVTREGKYFVNKTATSAGALGATLRAAGAQAGRGAPLSSLPLVINADLDASHRAVVWAMDVARQNGITHFSIATRPVQRPLSGAAR